MKILGLLTLVCIGLIFAGCATTMPADPVKGLKYGARMSAIEKSWGNPDETMAFQDYRAKGYFSVAGVGGSWSPQGGSVSGFGDAGTYTPTTIVWTYKDKDKGKALFFEKRGLFFDERHTLIMVWRLVGWEKLQKNANLPSAK